MAAITMQMSTAALVKKEAFLVAVLDTVGEPAVGGRRRRQHDVLAAVHVTGAEQAGQGDGEPDTEGHGHDDEGLRGAPA